MSVLFKEIILLVFPFVNGSGEMFGMIGRTSIRVIVVFRKKIHVMQYKAFITGVLNGFFKSDIEQETTVELEVFALKIKQ